MLCGKAAGKSKTKETRNGTLPPLRSFGAQTKLRLSSIPLVVRSDLERLNRNDEFFTIRLYFENVTKWNLSTTLIVPVI
jgi:hypothetical protein